MSVVKYHLLFIFLLFNLVFSINAYCKEDILKNRLTLSINLGSSFPMLTNGFLKEYNEQLGGVKTEFQTYWGFGASINYQLDSIYRISFKSEYIPSTLQDNFSQEIPDKEGFWRTYNEDITLTTIPIIVEGQYYQFYEKYKSYFGIGLGASYSFFKWTEVVTSPVQYDKRVGGTVYNQISFYPTIMAEFGIDLDWDKDHPDEFMKSVSISTNFYYIIRYPEVFHTLKKQIEPYPEELNGRKAVAPFYISLNFGLTFNIEK